MPNSLSTYLRESVVPRYRNKHYFDREPEPEYLAAVDRIHTAFNLDHTLDTDIYPDRRLYRYQLVMKHFPKAFLGTLLDIGDRSGALAEVSKKEVATVDKNNHQLTENFDWDKAALPFPDRSYDTVVCLDTLEHISDVGGALGDLLRTAKTTAIVSLPNCWRKTLSEIARGRSIRSSYGLPLVDPIDRHRWYFNVEEAEDFVAYRAAEHGFTVTGVAHHFPRLVWWHHVVYAFRIFLPERYFKNLFVQGVAFELTRTS